jgi:cytochrome c-type biogenesis protein CcmH
MKKIARLGRGRGRARDNDGRRGGRAVCGALAALLAPWLLVLAFAGMPSASPRAAEAPEVGEDPAIERHMMSLAAELRCLQCQNQTLADSEAPLAVDLRQEIRELIAKGQTDEQIKAYLVARYGDFVLYRPPLKSKTYLLWFGPALVLLAGLAALYFALKRRLARLDAAAGVAAGAGALSDADARRAQHLLADDAEEGRLS